MEIIDLNKNNIDMLLEFIQRNKSDITFFHPHNFTVNDIINILDKKINDQYKIIIHENKVVGYGLLRGWDENYEIPSLGIIIDFQFRGIGIANMFMIYLETESRLRGAKKIRLVVYKNNIKAINIYKKLGYDLKEYDETQLIGFKNL